jgi:excisionase family DNA binding protein
MSTSSFTCKDASAERPRHQQGGGGKIPKFFTVKQVAEALGVSSRTVRRWIKNEELAVHRFGGAVRVAEADLKAFLAAHRGD